MLSPPVFLFDTPVPHDKRLSRINKSVGNIIEMILVAIKQDEMT